MKAHMQPQRNKRRQREQDNETEEEAKWGHMHSTSHFQFKKERFDQKTAFVPVPKYFILGAVKSQPQTLPFPTVLKNLSAVEA